LVSGTNSAGRRIDRSRNGSPAFRAGAAAAAAGPGAVLDAARPELSAAAAADPPLVTDYLALADPVTFAEVGPGHQGPALLLVAGTVGKTRLIDNSRLFFGPLMPGPGR